MPALRRHAQRLLPGARTFEPEGHATLFPEEDGEIQRDERGVFLALMNLMVDMLYGVVDPMPADVRRAYLAPYDSWANRIATLRFVQDIPLSEDDAAWPLVVRAGKRLHRRAMELLLPAGLADRPKHGFSTPYDDWLRRSLGQEVERRYGARSSAVPSRSATKAPS